MRNKTNLEKKEMATNIMESNDNYLDRQFCKDLLAQTKDLACGGKKVFAFTRALRNNQYIYSCNVCGVEIGSEVSLQWHLDDYIHRELMKLDVLPYHNFMADAVIETEDPPQQHSFSGPMLDPFEGIHNLLSTISIKKATPNRIEFINSEIAAKSSEVGCDTEDSECEREKDDTGKKHRMGKLSNAHKQNERKRLSARKRSARVSVQSIESYLEEATTPVKFSLPLLEECTLPQEPEPSFMTTCRHLITLEPLINDDSIMTYIRRLFTQSIEYEREEFGSSDEMVDLNMLKFLHTLKVDFERNRNPFKPYHIIDAFNRALHHLTMNYAGAYAGEDDDDDDDDDDEEEEEDMSEDEDEGVASDPGYDADISNT